MADNNGNDVRVNSQLDARVVAIEAKLDAWKNRNTKTEKAASQQGDGKYLEDPHDEDEGEMKSEDARENENPKIRRSPDDHPSKHKKGWIHFPWRP